MKNQSLIGFTVEGFTELYKQYSKQLIEMIASKKITIILDFGLNAKDGPFEGIESVVRGVEVKYYHSCDQLLTNICLSTALT